VSGPEHYAAAEQLLGDAAEEIADVLGDGGKTSNVVDAYRHADYLTAKAQVHATLAHAAVLASALRDDLPGTQIDQWVKAGVL